MYFETERLIVDKLTMEDVDCFHCYRNKDEVSKYQSWSSYPLNIAKYRIIYCSNTIFNLNLMDYSMAVRLKDGTLIGDLFLKPQIYKKMIVGYTFDSIYWQQGYGYEVLEGLFIFLKKQGCKKIICHIYQDNMASKKLLEKCDFSLLRQSSYYNDATYEKKI